MANALKYKDISCKNYGLYIQNPPIIETPKRDIEQKVVFGRSGTTDIDNNRYDNVAVTYSLWFRSELNMVEWQADAIVDWLCTAPNFGKLEDTYNRDYFYRASMTESMSIESVLRRGAFFEVTFNCYPYKFKKSGQRYITVTDEKIIINPEKTTSLPIYVIKGTGAGSFSVNGDVIKIYDIKDETRIDTDTGYIYSDGVFTGKYTEYTEFKPLIPGKNEIKILSGNIQSVSVLGRWRRLI